jgi:hypothetical protein
MKLDRLTDLASQYERWNDGLLQPPYRVGKFIEWVDRRKRANRIFKDHASQQFYEHHRSIRGLILDLEAIGFGTDQPINGGDAVNVINAHFEHLKNRFAIGEEVEGI